jgi:hypothetical protein
MIEFKTTGLAELKTVYRELPDKIKRRVIARAARRAANVYLAEARRVAPVRATPMRGQNKRPAGTLKRALIVKRARELNTATSTGFLVTVLRGKKFQRVGKRGINKDAFYANWVHDGHRVVPRRSKSNQSGITARRRGAAGRVEGNPFLLNAFESASTRALDKFSETMQVILANPTALK